MHLFLTPDSIFVTKRRTFVKIKVFTASHADKASIQYGEFLKNDLKLVNKDDDTDLLDDFFITKLYVGTLHSYYYQNMKEDSIPSKRIIKDLILL